MVDLRAGGVDLGVEFELDGVRGFLRFRVALEGKGAGLDVELDLLFRDVRHGDGEEDVVLLFLARAGALCPCYCSRLVSLAG